MKRFLESGIRNVSRLSTARGGELGGSQANKTPIRRGKTLGQSPASPRGTKEKETPLAGAIGVRALPSCEAESVLHHDLKLFEKFNKNAKIINASAMTARSDPFLNNLVSPRNFNDRLNTDEQDVLRKDLFNRTSNIVMNIKD